MKISHFYNSVEANALLYNSFCRNLGSRYINKYNQAEIKIDLSFKNQLHKINMGHTL